VRRGLRPVLPTCARRLRSVTTINPIIAANVRVLFDLGFPRGPGARAVAHFGRAARSRARLSAVDINAAPTTRRIPVSRIGFDGTRTSRAAAGHLGGQNRASPTNFAHHGRSLRAGSGLVVKLASKARTRRPRVVFRNAPARTFLQQLEIGIGNPQPMLMLMLMPQLINFAWRCGTIQPSSIGFNCFNYD